ncbi:MAG: M42 family metallopeptidase [Gemmataceae bacterium]|jgi:endoglucanase
MEKESFDFLVRLIETPSPSGSESRIQQVVGTWAAELADHVRIDSHGNLIAERRASPAAIRGKAAERVMLAGHCDQLGLMVQYIDDQGFIYVQPVGGWDIAIILGQHLTLWTTSGPVSGVCSRKAPHLMTMEERNKLPQWHDLWIDIGARDRKEAEELAQPGDVLTAVLGLKSLRNNLVTGPGLDDKSGVWTVFEALRLLKGRELPVDVFFISTVQEEIGLRGATTSAFGIDPTVGIAVDVCHATDTPGNDKKQVGDIRLGQGPVLFRGPNINPHVLDHLKAGAARCGAPYQVRAVPKATGTDANAIQVSRAGVATGLIGIPNRYMHSPVESVHLDDLNHTARTLAEFCANYPLRDSWAP